jgi:hypothetical protein
LGMSGVDGPCPTAHLGRQAIMQVVITSTARMEIDCQPSNFKMRLSEGSTEVPPFGLSRPDSGQHTLCRSLREIATSFRMRVPQVMATTLRRAYPDLSIPFFWPSLFRQTVPPDVIPVSPPTRSNSQKVAAVEQIGASACGDRNVTPQPAVVIRRFSRTPRRARIPR